VAEASADEILDYARAIHAVIDKLGLDPASGGGGYRLIMNSGDDGGQEVAHLHAHILGGRPIGRMISGD
jgi:histidine triad (HIT) family protein